MIAVLPLLLYPLLGMSVFQLSQFLRKNESRSCVVGSEQLATEHRICRHWSTDGQFADDLFDDPAEARADSRIERASGDSDEATGSRSGPGSNLAICR